MNVNEHDARPQSPSGTTGSNREMGIAYLTLAPLPAPEAVTVASEAGADFLGVRVKPFNANDPSLDMEPRSRTLRETATRLGDTGLHVLDIEFVLLDETIRRDDWLPALESGAFLGASLLSVAISDSDRSRALDNLAALTADAAAHGIRPALEPISYQRLSTLSEALSAARATGSAVLVDPLHLTRAHTPFDTVADVEADLFPVLQLCDAPADAPGDGGILALSTESRSNRLPVGAGELPLAKFVRFAPPSIPVSVEVPNTALRERMSDVDFVAVNLRAARDLLATLASATGEQS
ncbi:hypothetical protein BOH66_06270 [Microbacterium aurum]|uniref:Xylose isomerase-like TIM barrel domain-containing protein n=1 Tax=Microbacterium aurum TaxID=36805 RepID=A0A1P8U729_9MICO|nr:TIM barrel protein [Microbacterium aurum]APZ33904.1 hypothetical protein BOH66_06270 [Microbacterium aurum]MBM7827665.1 sugar phosphate isomerase/epimerase [Microbacterium aurum]